MMLDHSREDLVEVADLSAFRDLWSLRPFRVAFLKLIALPREQREQIRDLLRSSEPPDQPIASSALEGEYPTDVVMALSSLIRIAEDEGLEDLTADLEQLLDREQLAQVEDLTNLLATSDEETQRAHVAAAQNSVLPVLLAIEINVDYRVVPQSRRDPPVQLVPVLIARAQFDEPVSGGHTAIVFQIPDHIVDKFTGAFKKAQTYRHESMRYLPQDLLPGLLRANDGEEDAGSAE